MFTQHENKGNVNQIKNEENSNNFKCGYFFPLPGEKGKIISHFLALFCAVEIREKFKISLIKFIRYAHIDFQVQ